MIGTSLLPVDLVGHDVVEIVSSDKSIIIKVSLGEDVVPFIVGKVLAEFLAELFQLKNGDLSLN